MSKSFLASRTFWVNTVALAYGLVTFYHGQAPVPTDLVMAVTTIANLVLRFQTTGPITIG